MLFSYDIVAENCVCRKHHVSGVNQRANSEPVQLVQRLDIGFQVVFIIVVVLPGWLLYHLACMRAWQENSCHSCHAAILCVIVVSYRQEDTDGRNDNVFRDHSSSPASLRHPLPRHWHIINDTVSMFNPRRGIIEMTQVAEFGKPAGRPTPPGVMENAECRMDNAAAASPLAGLRNSFIPERSSYPLVHYPLPTIHVKGAAAAAGTHQDAISIIPVGGAVVLSDTKFG
jgi:hypothetical protein